MNAKARLEIVGLFLFQTNLTMKTYVLNTKEKHLLEVARDNGLDFYRYSKNQIIERIKK